MKLLAALILTLAAANTMAAPFADGDAKRGKKFFDDNQCNECHIGKVGGDGNDIFTRPNRIIHNSKELIERMRMCSGAIGKTLTPQNELDLAAYLNQTYYKFK